jgi:hypothetical protein
MRDVLGAFVITLTEHVCGVEVNTPISIHELG